MKGRDSGAMGGGPALRDLSCFKSQRHMEATETPSGKAFLPSPLRHPSDVSVRAAVLLQTGRQTRLALLRLHLLSARGVVVSRSRSFPLWKMGIPNNSSLRAVLSELNDW